MCIDSFGVDLELLKSSIGQKLAWLSANIKRDKRKTRNIELVGAGAAATTSVLIGLSKFIPALSDVLQALALVISAIGGVLVAWDKLFDHKRLWILSASMYNDFENLQQDLLHAEKTNTLSDSTLKTFYGQYKQVMQRGKTEWEQLRRAQK